MIAITLPWWLALIVTLMVAAPALIMTSAAVWCVHFVWLRIWRPFAWGKKNIHFL